MRIEPHRGNGAGRDLDEIERDVQSIRSDMGETLRQLEQRFSPRDLLEQLTRGTQTFGTGSSDFVKNLGAAVRDNPVPMLLLATGAASLLWADRNAGSVRSSRPRGSRALDTLKEGTEAARERATDLAEGAKERASQFADDAKDLAEDARNRASRFAENAKELAENTRDRASQLQGRVREGADELRQRGDQLLHEQPMIVVGVGLTLGAILGASLPTSERERSAARPLAQRALGTVNEALQRGNEALQRGAERVQGTSEGGDSDSDSDSDTDEPANQTAFSAGAPAGVLGEPRPADPTDIPIEPEDERIP